MTCHNCQTGAKRFGFTRQGHQRYRCRQCGKTFADIPDRPLDELRVPTDKGIQVINLLVEGVGVRAISRLTGLAQQTVLNVIEVAGHKCARLLDEKIRNVEVDSVQADEVWAFVFCKNANNRTQDPEHGDQYTFLACDRKSKLIIAYSIGRRTVEVCQDFLADVRERVKGQFQITTDGYVGFVRAAFSVCHDTDFATQTKVFAASPLSRDSNFTARRYSPGRMSTITTRLLRGFPDPAKISTSHAERLNLSIRLFNRKLTRLTLGYAKTLVNFKYCQAIQIAHFNFCRKHSAHGQTPAQAAGLTDRKWEVADLLNGSGQPA